MGTICRKIPLSVTTFILSCGCHFSTVMGCTLLDRQLAGKEDFLGAM